MVTTLNTDELDTSDPLLKFKNTVILYNPLPGYSNEDKGVPLSILSIAAPLEFKNYDIKILDAKVEDRPGECIRQALRYLDDVVCVGITTMTGPQVKGEPVLADPIVLAKHIRPRSPAFFSP